MKMRPEDLLLYAVTDRLWLGDHSLAQDVAAALAGGITFLQLREKDLDEAGFLAEARELKALAANYGVPFVINDNVDIALAVDADGVHIGQSDGAVKAVRAQLGPDKILGVSASTVAEALAAEADGADYLGVGAIYATDTKTDAAAVGPGRLAEICAAVEIPVVAIGGLNKNNLKDLAGTGVDGAALVSAIFAQDDIGAAAKALRTILEGVIAS